MKDERVIRIKDQRITETISMNYTNYIRIKGFRMKIRLHCNSGWSEESQRSESKNRGAVTCFSTNDNKKFKTPQG